MLVLSCLRDGERVEEWQCQWTPVISEPAFLSSYILGLHFDFFPVEMLRWRRILHKAEEMANLYLPLRLLIIDLNSHLGDMCTAQYEDRVCRDYSWNPKTKRYFVEHMYMYTKLQIIILCDSGLCPDVVLEKPRA